MLVKRQESRVESQKRVVALRSDSGSRLLTLRSRLSRRGFTLIELLIVILIISILAALVLGVAAVAGETARQAQSKHIVERLHTLLTEYYDTYQNAAREVANRRTSRELVSRSRSMRNIRDAADRGQATGRSATVRDARNDAHGSSRPVERRVADRSRADDHVLQRCQRGKSAVVSGEPHRICRTSTCGATSSLAVAQELTYRYYRTRRATSEATRAPNACTWSSRWPAATAKRDRNSKRPHRRHRRRRCAGVSRRLGTSDQFPALGAGLRFADRAERQYVCEYSDNEFGQPIGRRLPRRITIRSTCFDATRIAFRLVPLIYSPGRDETSGLNAAESFVTWRTSNVSTLTFNSSGPPFIHVAHTHSLCKGISAVPDRLHRNQSSRRRLDQLSGR